jgi:hypothetical protein
MCFGSVARRLCFKVAPTKRFASISDIFEDNGKNIYPPSVINDDGDF